jgi:hypothetical protein
MTAPIDSIISHHRLRLQLMLKAAAKRLSDILNIVTPREVAVLADHRPRWVEYGDIQRAPNLTFYNKG